MSAPKWASPARRPKPAPEWAAAGRQGAYASGIIAATAAFMSDAEQLGALADAEILGTADDDAPAVCACCEMRRLGFSGLADRLEFANSVIGGLQ